MCRTKRRGIPIARSRDEIPRSAPSATRPQRTKISGAFSTLERPSGVTFVESRPNEGALGRELRPFSPLIFPKTL